MRKRSHWRWSEERSRRQFQVRLWWLSGALAVMISLVGWRVVDLQVVRGAELATRAERQHERLIPIEAERGTIFDRKGRILAMNSESPSIFAVPTAIENPKTISRRLAKTLGLKNADLVRRLSSDREFVWVKRHVTPAAAEAALKQGGEGVAIVSESRRFYPKRSLMGHLIGFAGLDNQGLEGLELSYDRLLRGERGWLMVERDATGRIVIPKGPWPRHPSRGKDLQLTVDEVIQYTVERALDVALRETRAARAMAIMMEPNTGAILAMAVRPEFNPNHVADLEAGQWKNRVITDLYEPGSTVKPLVLAGAIEDGVVDLQELIDCEEGTMMVTARTRLRDHLPHGLLTPPEIIQVSSNIGAAKIGMRLGADRLHDWFSIFGLGRSTGIDLAGEVGGLLRPVSEWSGLSLTSLSIGQEMAITPLQLTVAYAALANGGWLVRPHLVDVVIEPDGTRLGPVTVGPITRIISSETAEKVRDILTLVIQPEGTGASAAIDGFRVAGKTGTAQKINPSTGRYDPALTVGSFIGFVPAETPAFVLLVVIDEPEGRGWGSVVAAPVFQKIASETLHYLGVMPQSAPEPSESAPVHVARSRSPRRALDRIEQDQPRRDGPAIGGDVGRIASDDHA